MEKHHYSTLVDLLRWQASAQPDEILYTFLSYPKGSVEEEHLTYGELDRRAHLLGAHLQKLGAQGQRILLLYPPGPDYIVAFFGCLYAGAIAVPTYPPQLKRLGQQNRTLSKRFYAILKDAQPLLALMMDDLFTKLSQLQLSDLAFVRLLSTDSLLTEDTQWVPPAIGPDTLAFLQYTSGSTSSPKGVMLTHANLLYNLAIIQRYFEHDTQSRGVIWLPPYHDMGLIGGILQPLYVGFPVVLLSPLSFLQQPVRWLEAISHYRATTSGGPNFAYDLCVRKISAEERAKLDLSSWRVAFNGAEPIRAETMRRFVAAFAASGFRPETFHPCYGLAEATLMVSGSDNATSSLTLSLQGEALQHSRVAFAAPDEEQYTIVSSGKPALEQQLLIVDSQSLMPCVEHQVGEIWVAGGSVASGYWEREEPTSETFHAFTTNGDGPFLRTGDLGFLYKGELFVTGRVRDLIIIRGANYYPQDIEQCIEETHPALRADCIAAFSLEIDGEEKLALVCEIERTQRQTDLHLLLQSIRQTIAQEYALEAHTIALLKAGSIPKTSSGKLQRSACRTALLAGELEILTESTLEAHISVLQEESVSLLTRHDLLAAEASQRQELAQHYLRTCIADLAGETTTSSFMGDQPLTSIGFDSLKAIELTHRVQTDLDSNLALDLLLSGASISDLAAELVRQVTENTQRTISRPVTDLVQPQPLSRSQRALWFLQQLAPTNTAYNIARAVRIHSTFNIVQLEEAFHRLVRRHPALRTTFTLQDNAPIQLIHLDINNFFSCEDAAQWDTKQLMERAAREAHQTFDLVQGPLFRVWVFTRSGDTALFLLVGHHLILDFWSLTILTHELGILYQEIHDGVVGTLPALSLQYPDYVQWQEDLLDGARGEALWQYWQKQLAGELPVSHFPTDYLRPAVQTYSGAFQTVGLSKTITEQLKVLSQSQHTTLYTVLFAAFQILLTRYCGQEDIVVGTLTNGRSQGQFKDVVGYFVNPLVIRVNLSGNPSFEEYLVRVRETILAAFAHQDLPFATVAEKFQPVRDPGRTPIFQTMFIWQKAPGLSGVDLTPLALNLDGFAFSSGGLQMETVELGQYTTQFDLTLAMGETDAGLQASLQYNTDLFSETTIASLLANFATLLEGIVLHPTAPLANLPIFSTRIKEQLLSVLSKDGSDYPTDICIHELFELQVQQQPMATALVYQDLSLSYAELNCRANQLAWYLRKCGVGPDTLVGICLDRSIELLVGLLAIMKAGGAYVPLDPGYPRERLVDISANAAFTTVITSQRNTALFQDRIDLICLDNLQAAIDQEQSINLSTEVSSGNLAYVIYTSGSTGKPKGVMLEHRGVINFFKGMDERIGCSQADTVLALTSVSFDISVLELFWTLMHGAKVVLLGENAVLGASGSSEDAAITGASEHIDFSLFYFANEEANVSTNRYRLLIEGARFADQHGFTAVWTPERHFHSFGGLYPNPAITSAALATITEHVQLRAGSVVLPLHNPIRIAEEWSVIDNLSNGRVGLAFASGWHANDFVFFPQHHTDRKKIMFDGIQTVQHLWEGQTVSVMDGSGKEISVKIFPAPLQTKLPIWITAAGSEETFSKAGEIGANILTHLLGQSPENVARKIQLYRDSLERHGFDRDAGQVTLMLHTFIGLDKDTVREKIRIPFTNYLRTSVGLIENLIQTLNLPLDLTKMNPKDMDDLLAFAVDRYFETSALFGTPESCTPLVKKLKMMGVNEIACLIDFGIDTDDVLSSLPHLNTLRELANSAVKRNDYTLTAQAATYKPTLMQCTPSAMRLINLDQKALTALGGLRSILLGGEALPSALVENVQEKLPVHIENMYGPTETTIWSATFTVKNGEVPEIVPIGYPIVNTSMYVLDSYLNLVPPGVVGEIYIGGDGLARGYLRRPDLTAERFIPDPFSFTDGRRLYRTGDLGRYHPDGLFEFLGRVDQQVKIRGFRIELEEIEVVLRTHPALIEAVVTASSDGVHDKRLVAYCIPTIQTPTQNDLRTFLKERLPDYMLPAAFVMLTQFPLTANGKIDRKALAFVESTKTDRGDDHIAPRNRIERILMELWCQALHVESVGVYDNFFDLGGHSLLVAQIHGQLREALKQELPLVKLLEYPTIDSLARYIDTLDTGQDVLKQSVDRAKVQREAQMRRLQRLRS